MLMFSKNVPYIAQAGLLLSLGADSHAKKLINDALAEMTDGICEFAQGYMRADLQLVVAALKATVDALEAVLNDDDTSFMDRKDLYAWHISDLKIYDQPKSLSGFSRHDFRGMNGTDVCGNESCEHYQPSGSYMLPPTCAINGCCLSKPPQSWCYVAEAEEDDAL